MDRIPAQRLPAVIGLFALGLMTGGPACAGKLDALRGDWDLMVAKSTFKPSPPMKKCTMKVIDAGSELLLIKSDWIEADGSVGHVEYATSFDGRAVAVVDYPAADTVIDTILGRSRWQSVWLKNGRVVERETETLSPDGNTIRETDEGTDLHGHRYRNHLVFERP